MATTTTRFPSVSRRLRLPSRAAWLGARATNVLRRPRRLLTLGIATFVAVLGGYIAFPLGVDKARQIRPARLAAAQDTIGPMRELLRARTEVLRIDSALAVARVPAETPVVVPFLTADQRRQRDSLGTQIAQLSALVQRASTSPLAESYRALAGAPALRGDAGMRALLDSLVDIEREREELGGGGATVDPVYVALTTEANAKGRAMLAIAERELAQLQRAVADIVPAPAVAPSAPPVEPTQLADTLALSGIRQQLAGTMQASERNLARVRASNAARDSVSAAQRASTQLAPVPVLLLAAFTLAAFVALTLGLVDEMRSPRVADANEAERLSGLRVLSVARQREVPQERARRAADRTLPVALDPTSDQYRMLAWHLTSPWPREGIVTVTGDRPEVAATVAANLAAVFAVDARSTLLVDADFSLEPVRAVLALPKSPGLAAAIENKRKWSESLLSVPVGRSRSMDVLPAGTRDRPLGPAEAQAAIADVRRAAQRHDATVIVASGPQSLKLRAGDDVVICAVQGVTRLATLARAVASLIEGGARVRGVVLWEGDEPVVAQPA